jgi:hypothetical protein
MPTLLIPLRYLAIRHSFKLTYDVVLPLMIGLTLSALLLGLPKPVPIFGKDAYFGQIQGLLTILGGFFVAALTLITTDKSELLQEPVGGMDPPRLPKEKCALSRKRFLAYLFGYLSTSSFLLVAISLVAGLVAPQVGAALHGPLRSATKWAAVVLFNVWLAHVFVSTMLGLFYFTERLQTSDRQMKVRRPDAPPEP